MSIPLSFVLVALMIILSAFFSATEKAFLILNKNKLKSQSNSKIAKLVLSLEEKQDRLLVTILICNNLANVTATVIGTILCLDLIKNKNYATLSAIGILTLLILIFGEFTPKTISKHIPEKFAKFSAPIMLIFIIILFPISFVFTLWNKLICKIFGLKKDSKISQKELLMMFEEVENNGIIDETEGDLIRNAIEFNDRTAEEILTHRVEIEAVPISASKEEIARSFNESRFSRILVYNETIDEILGVIHQKDFYVGDGIYKGNIKELITPPVFVHKTEKISDLLRHLQMKKSHMAIVIDEYGGTLGIVTMEDILEELVGEIWDEHDDVIEDVQVLDKNAFLVDGTLTIDEFCEEFNVECKSESVSLGGFIMEQIGKVPEKGDSFDYKGLRIIVNSVDSHRADSVKVIKLPQKEELNKT